MEDSFIREPRDLTRCAGCARKALVLRSVDGAQLCPTCAAASLRIDAQLAMTASGDPVACDACGVAVDFDARVAVITRECGGTVLCDRCIPVEGKGAVA